MMESYYYKENSTIQNMFRKYGRCINKMGIHHIFPPVICKDGYFMSVQAGMFMNSSPEEDLEDFGYDCVEVYSSEEDTTELQWFANSSKDTFGYVPTEVVDKIINKHGGLDEEAINKAIKKAADRA